jgi:hypothetical protein
MAMGTAKARACNPTAEQPAGSHRLESSATKARSRVLLLGESIPSRSEKQILQMNPNLLIGASALSLAKNGELPEMHL